MSEKLVIPELRFVEFEGDWQYKQLDSFTEKIQDGTHFSPELIPNGTRKYITSKNIRNGILDLSELDYISQEAHEKIYSRCNVKYSDVLLTKDGAGTGNLCINYLKEEFSLLSSVAFIRANDKVSTNFFIYQLLLSPEGQKEILRSIAGQAITRITLTKLRNFNFCIPKLPEQQKIASFLTSIDERIRLLRDKKAQLQQYKKGIMQQLFSQELRFKPDHPASEGKKENNYPDWEEKRLGEILKVGSGKDYKHLNEGEIPVLGTGGVMIYVNDFLYEGESVCIGRKGTIDHPMFISGKFWTVDTLFYTHSFNQVIPYFVYLLFQMINWKKHNEASGVPSLSKATIEKLTVLIPCQAEQQKIASFLSAIDDAISHVTDQITQTEHFKKGLLQKMFV
ncbi:restriction endonuclease subunit S [Reichenbachiella ulvae]|uniref:Restriction endonuclease subunit S n=1 Tax=Reichenbachiella ulvae TaxID=2980104 RepID=A0ABT3CZL0_9BACT|nr:restriction endonuclease subunit S [Reichenbachiella ulvae]MCV9389140.1 restriction endonuclease subunit S [Reichenbachiella ulvae]